MAKILLVEDDPLLREQYALYLRAQDGGGHEVDEARSATQAVGLLKDTWYDLVLLDIMLAYEKEDDENQEIDEYEVDYGRKMGLHVYKKIRELKVPPPVILISVVTEYGVLAEFPEVVGRLAKYFSLPELGEMVSRSLG